MKPRFLFFLLVSVTLTFGPAHSKGQGFQISLDKKFLGSGAQGKQVARFCLNPKDGSSDCSVPFVLTLKASGDPLTTDIDTLCLLIDERATIVRDEWILSARQEPGVALYRLDCQGRTALPVLSRGNQPTANPGQGSATRQARTPSSPPSTPPSSPQPSPAASNAEILAALQRIEKRLATMEKDLERPVSLFPVTEGQARLKEAIDAWGQQLLQEVTKKPTQVDKACTRMDGVYDGRPEIVIQVQGAMLRFVRIEAPDHGMLVGISEGAARTLLKEAQKGSQQPRRPGLLLSTPEVAREVESFYLQERLIEPALYKKLLGENARRVSLEQARQFLDRLNKLCHGTARFDLPTEEQFVVAANLVYDWREGGMRSCEALRWVGTGAHISQLLGHFWQWTQSPCIDFRDNPTIACERGHYIRKGGSRASSNPTECLPEYRAQSSPKVAPKETTFRLVLAE